jgi:H+/Cl- antiporter ClcA
MLAVSSPIPGGILSPAFILGSVFGRLYGHILKHIGLALGWDIVRCNDSFAIYIPL